VYEDIKMLLGNVQRNKTLRALVRYSIERDEKVAPVKVTDPRPPPEGGGEAAESPGRGGGLGVAGHVDAE
jgi:hypothetical protein